MLFLNSIQFEHIFRSNFEFDQIRTLFCFDRIPTLVSTNLFVYFSDKDSFCKDLAKTLTQIDGSIVSSLIFFNKVLNAIIDNQLIIKKIAT